MFLLNHNGVTSSCASPWVIISAGNLLSVPFSLMEEYKLQPGLAFCDYDQAAQWPLFNPVHIGWYNAAFCSLDSGWYHAGNYLDGDHMLLGHALSEILLLLTKPENVRPLIDNEVLVGSHIWEDWAVHERWCPSNCCPKGILLVSHKCTMFYQGRSRGGNYTITLSGSLMLILVFFLLSSANIGRI